MDLTGCGEQMRILKTGKFRECNAIAVVPTMDAEGSHFVPLAGELTRLGIAIIAVEDRPPAFRFSRSMNRGISEALEYGPDAIILSNDDVSNIVSLECIFTPVRFMDAIEFVMTDTQQSNSRCPEFLFYPFAYWPDLPLIGAPPHLH